MDVFGLFNRSMPVADWVSLLIKGLTVGAFQTGFQRTPFFHDSDEHVFSIVSPDDVSGWKTFFPHGPTGFGDENAAEDDSPGRRFSRVLKNVMSAGRTRQNSAKSAVYG